MKFCNDATVLEIRLLFFNPVPFMDAKCFSVLYSLEMWKFCVFFSNFFKEFTPSTVCVIKVIKGLLVGFAMYT